MSQRMADMEEQLAKQETLANNFNTLLMRGMVKVMDNGEILPVENWNEHEDMKNQINK